MSAIYGFREREGRPASLDDLEAMGRAVEWMGGDGDDAVVSGHVALGRKRFDVGSSTSAGPDLESGGIRVTGDLRLDRRADLAAALGFDGRDLSTLADEALVAHAWRRWGEDFARHLEGDFSFVLFDSAKDVLVAVQSPFPLHPIYWVETPRRFAFASRVAALLELGEVSPSLDVVSFATTFVTGLTRLDGANTCFEGVRSLGGGHMLISSETGVRESRHFPPDGFFEGVRAPPRDWPERLRDVLEEAVASRIAPSSRVGVLLSGGLDSSALACLARRATDRERSSRELIAFSSVLDEPGPFEEDESPYIDEVVRHAAFESVRVTPPERPSPYEILPEVFEATERPIGFREYLFAALYSAARDRGCRVVLDGSGGELGPTDHGRGVYARHLLRGRWLLLAREVLLRSRVEGRSISRIVRSEVLKPLARSIGRARRHDRFVEDTIAASPLRASSRVTAGLEERVREVDVARLLERARIDPVRATRENIVLWQFPTNLLAPRFGVRAYHPFFDVRVLVASLPLLSAHAKREGWRRYPIRRALEGILPERIRWRKDKGAFSPDYSRRILRAMDEARERVRELSRQPIVAELLDLRAIESMAGEAERAIRARRSNEEPAEAKRLHRALIAAEFLAWFDAKRRGAKVATSARETSAR